MEILAQAAEAPVGTVPGLAIVLVVGVVVVALTGLSRSMVAERGTDRRLLRAERKGREQVEQGFRDAIVLRLVELTPDPDAAADDQAGGRPDGGSESVDLTESESIDLATPIDLTAEDVAEDAPRATD